jgi:hypothetical protein
VILLLACIPEPVLQPGDERAAEQLATAGLTLPWGAGRGLAGAEDVVLIGVPGTEGTETYVEGALVVAELPSLTERGRWSGAPGLGEPVRVAGDQVAVAVQGGVYLLDGIPEGEGELASVAVGSVWESEPGSGFGRELCLGEELLVLDRAAVYAFSLPLLGESSEQDAARTLQLEAGYANAVAWWDPDGDGQDDLVVDEHGELALYAGPWEADLVSADATTRWGAASNGSALQNLGDLDGDGLAELGFGAHTSPEPDRQGAVWLLRGGDLAGGPLDELPDKIVGGEPGMWLGTDMESADLDGDGQAELLIGTLEEIFTFVSPAGALTSEDALVYVRGVGWELVVTDWGVVSCGKEDAALFSCWLLPESALR